MTYEQDLGTEDRSQLGLILGIISIPIFIVGIFAWAISRRTLKRIKAGLVTPDSRGKAKAGMILGIIGTFLTPVFLLYGTLTFAGETEEDAVTALVEVLGLLLQGVVS